MSLHNLTPADGSVKSGKRIARGQGSGRGGTSTRGHNGAKSRSGYSRKRAFEGGQMPLQMRLPKRGFTNHNNVTYVGLNLDWLSAYSEKFKETEITPASLAANGIIKKSDKIKVLGRGEISTSLKITTHAISESAKSAIEGKGGSITIA
jgi:large subunit ribosomal protein L15